MRRPPEPQYSFTIPSIHDDTTLDCRLYHPNDILVNKSQRRKGSANTSSEEVAVTQWRKKGIIMAHPYAPMGGSYDDRVVGMVVEEFLKLGWVVGTFNFRYVCMCLVYELLGFSFLLFWLLVVLFLPD